MATAAQIKSAKATLSAARVDKGLSVKGILRKCPAYQKNLGADTVTIKKYKPDARTKGRHYAVTAVCISDAKRPTPHRCSVIGLDKTVTKVSAQKKVSISCDCEDWCFTWEYAMSTWGAASIKYSNGDPAVMKNPGNHPGACKHLCAVLALIVSRGD